MHFSAAKPVDENGDEVNRDRWILLFFFFSEGRRTGLLISTGWTMGKDQVTSDFTILPLARTGGSLCLWKSPRVSNDISSAVNVSLRENIHPYEGKMISAKKKKNAQNCERRGDERNSTRVHDSS